MKQHLFSKILLLLLYCTALPHASTAQESYFKPPIINIDFGDNSNPRDMELRSVRKYYSPRKGICPDDGQFAFVSFTSDCFFGNWITVPSDHTPGSVNGRMMLVNAAYQPGPFFAVNLTGLRGNATYELSAWFVNVCRNGEGCDPTPPLININVSYGTTKLTQFQIGPIYPTGAADWGRYAGMFTTPEGVTSVFITMSDQVSGGCGNDFAMDDIQVREYVVKPVEPPAPKPVPPVVTKPVENKPVPKPVVKNTTPEPVVPKKNVTVINKETVNRKPVVAAPVIKAQPNNIPVPNILKTRDNALAKKIETPESEITIDLYDNGEIDGDTVTIYHNNALVVSHAGLSTKAVTLKIKVDENNPHHELVMVADNLGSIPPNTSLMVVTAKDKRYEVFISSSEQKNAKVVIDLKKE